MRAFVAVLVLAAFSAGCLDGRAPPALTSGGPAEEAVQAPTADEVLGPGQAEDPPHPAEARGPEAVPAANVSGSPPANATPANATPAAGPPPVWAVPGEADLFPGITDESGCTTNFLFTTLDNRRLFLGSAAHCFADSAEAGRACDPEGTAPFEVGRPIRFRVPTQTILDDLVGGEDVAYLDINGTLAYTSWGAMLAAGEEDPVTCSGNDFALLEIPLAQQGRMTPTIPGLGVPTGVAAPEDLPLGADIVSYGNSDLWFGVDLAKPKEGKVTMPPADAAAWSFVAAFLPPGVPGDSGSAALTANGKAAGVLSSYAWPDNGKVGTGEYAYLPAVLAYMEAHGGPAVKLAVA